jgi:ABC-2 type transport system ATP-binding protein
VVALEGFSKSYGKYRAVTDVSFTAEQGTITGLLGPNGSGKTTILKAIAAIHFPTTGSVRVGQLTVRDHAKKIRARTGYAAEHAHLCPEFTVREMLLYTAAITVDAEAVLDAVDYAVKTLSLGDVLTTKVSHLSKGYAQRVSLALALLHKPDVLVLDEPASGLDPAQIHELRELLKQLAKTKTIILSTHLIQEAELLCSVIHIMQNGVLAASGSKESLLAQTGASSLEQAYLLLCPPSAKGFHA